MLESLVNEVPGLRVFSGEICKAPFFTEHLQWLLPLILFFQIMHKLVATTVAIVA